MRLRATLIVLAAFAVLLTAAGPAVASTPSPWWRLTSGSRPTNLSVGEGQVVVTAEDLGDADATGGIDPIELRDHLRKPRQHPRPNLSQRLSGRHHVQVQVDRNTERL